MGRRTKTTGTLGLNEDHTDICRQCNFEIKPPKWKLDYCSGKVGQETGWQEKQWIMCHLSEGMVKSPSPYGLISSNAPPHSHRSTLKHAQTHRLRFSSIKQLFHFLIFTSINSILWHIWSALNQRQMMIINEKVTIWFPIAQFSSWVNTWKGRSNVLCV